MSREADRRATLHATCVVVGEAGILIRGPSGTGKSTLAQALIAAAGRTGFARLVCDDRVRVENCHGRLIARAVPAIAGLVEARGVGILPVAFETAAVIRLVVDGGGPPAERLPEAAQTQTRICGVTLARIAGPLDEGLCRLILARAVTFMTR